MFCMLSNVDLIVLKNTFFKHIYFKCIGFSKKKIKNFILKIDRLYFVV